MQSNNLYNFEYISNINNFMENNNNILDNINNFMDKPLQEDYGVAQALPDRVCRPPDKPISVH